MTTDAAYDQIRSTRGPTKRCSACGTDHPVEQFAFKSVAARKLHSRCRAAQGAYNACWYEQNRETHRPRAVATRTERVQTLHALIDRWLAGRTCPCGSCDRLVAVGSAGCSLKTMVKNGANEKDISDELRAVTVRCRSCSWNAST